DSRSRLQSPIVSSMFLEPQSRANAPPRAALEPPTRARPKDEWNVGGAAWMGFVFALLIAVASSHALAVIWFTAGWQAAGSLPDAAAIASVEDESAPGPWRLLNDSDVSSSDPVNDLTDEEVEDS